MGDLFGTKDTDTFDKEAFVMFTLSAQSISPVSCLAAPTSLSGFLVYDTDCVVSGIQLPLILVLTFAFSFAVWAFEACLDIRQKRTTFIKNVPRKLMDVVDPITVGAHVGKGYKEGEEDNTEGTTSLSEQIAGKFEKAQLYSRDKINFQLFSSTYQITESTATTLLGSLPFFWYLSSEFSKAHFGWDPKLDELKVSCVFFVLTTLVGELTQLPFSLVSSPPSFSTRNKTKQKEKKEPQSKWI